MLTIQKNSANELFVSFCRKLLKDGEISSPRGLKTIELQNVWLTLTNPKKSIVTLKQRKLDKEYLQAEMAWYESGDLSIKEISKHSKFWNTICDDYGFINSNYGYLAFREKANGKSQYQWCLDRLTNDIDTRQAIINYNQPRHKIDGNKDFVCTMNQVFRVNKGRLDTTVFMRSQDLIYGLSYDMPWFCYVQEKLAKDLGLKVGVYNNFSATLHVYERHFDMIKKIARSR